MALVPPRPTRKQRLSGDAYHHGDLRRALIEAAIAILEQKGTLALTLREAARSAGVSHAAPAHHFGDLTGLLAAIAERGFVALASRMRLAAARARGAEAQLRALGTAYVEFATGHPAQFRVMFHPALADKSRLPDLQLAAEETFGLLAEGVRAGQRAGALRRCDPMELALGAWSGVHGFSCLAIDGQLEKPYLPRDKRALAGRVVGGLGLGLAARRGR